MKLSTKFSKQSWSQPGFQQILVYFVSEIELNAAGASQPPRQEAGGTHQPCNAQRSSLWHSLHLI